MSMETVGKNITFTNQANVSLNMYVTMSPRAELKFR